MSLQRKPFLMFSSDITAPPQLEPMRTLEVQCFHCHRYTRFLPESVIDAETEMWRSSYHALIGFINDEVEKYHAKHGLTPPELEWRDVVGRLCAMVAGMRDRQRAAGKRCPLCCYDDQGKRVAACRECST